MSEEKRDYSQPEQPKYERERKKNFFPDWLEIQSRYSSLSEAFELASDGDEYLREGLERGFPELLSDKEVVRPRKLFLSEIKRGLEEGKNLENIAGLLSWGSHDDIPEVILNQLKAMVGKKIERNIRVNYRGKEYCVFDIYPEVGEIGQTITEEEIEKISVLYIVPVKNIADTNF
jgi:hypothetical protein